MRSLRCGLHDVLECLHLWLPRPPGSRPHLNAPGAPECTFKGPPVSSLLCSKNARAATWIQTGKYNKLAAHHSVLWHSRYPLLHGLRRAPLNCSCSNGRTLSFLGKTRPDVQFKRANWNTTGNTAPDMQVQLLTNQRRSRRDTPSLSTTALH